MGLLWLIYFYFFLKSKKNQNILSIESQDSTRRKKLKVTSTIQSSETPTTDTWQMSFGSFLFICGYKIHF